MKFIINTLFIFFTTTLVQVYSVGETEESESYLRGNAIHSYEMMDNSLEDVSPSTDPVLMERKLKPHACEADLDGKRVRIKRFDVDGNPQYLFMKGTGSEAETGVENAVLAPSVTGFKASSDGYIFKVSILDHSTKLLATFQNVAREKSLSASDSGIVRGKFNNLKIMWKLIAPDGDCDSGFRLKAEWRNDDNEWLYVTDNLKDSDVPMDGYEDNHVKGYRVKLGDNDKRDTWYFEDADLTL